VKFREFWNSPPATFSIIDIAAVSPAFKKIDILECQEILSKTHHQFGEPIQPIGLTPDQVKENNGFLTEIVDNGIFIYTK